MDLAKWGSSMILAKPRRSLTPGSKDWEILDPNKVEEILYSSKAEYILDSSKAYEILDSRKQSLGDH
nr:hypothetical protein CFP56_17754 [Quercus suber]